MIATITTTFSATQQAAMLLEGSAKLANGYINRQLAAQAATDALAIQLAVAEATHELQVELSKLPESVQSLIK